VTMTLRFEQPVARKEHQCDYCLGPIPQGEQYSSWSGIYDGEMQSNKMHLECQADFEINGQDEFMPGDGEMPERIKELVKQRRKP
jgi:hypothetical protein